MRDYEEKRLYNRMQVETHVQFTLNNSDTMHEGISHDLSATGMLLSSRFRPNEGDAIEIMVNSSNDRLPPLLAKGNVVRVVPDPDLPDHFLISTLLTMTE